MNRITILLVALTMSACATTKDSTWLGGTMGAVAGGIIGHNANPDNNNSTTAGIAVGAASGALIGYLINRANKKPGTAPADPKQKKIENDLPSLTRPEWRRVWVEDKVEGNKLIKGHFIYIIEKNSQWSVD